VDVELSYIGGEVVITSTVTPGGGSTPPPTTDCTAFKTW